jgi:hypothetical protein
MTQSVPARSRHGTRFMTQIVPTKLKTKLKHTNLRHITTFSGGTPHDDAERAGTLMNGENSSRSEVCSMMWWK